MEKVTYTTVETVTTFTLAEVFALLLREAGMPDSSVTQAHMGPDGLPYQFTITHRKEGDDRPQAAPADTQTTAAQYNTHRVGGRNYTYPEPLPYGYRWAPSDWPGKYHPEPVPAPMQPASPQPVKAEPRDPYEAPISSRDFNRGD